MTDFLFKQMGARAEISHLKSHETILTNKHAPSSQNRIQAKFGAFTEREENNGTLDKKSE